MNRISITGYKASIVDGQVETRTARSNIVVHNVITATNLEQIEVALKEMHERYAGQMISFVLRVSHGRKPRGFDNFIKKTPLTLINPTEAA